MIIAKLPPEVRGSRLSDVRGDGQNLIQIKAPAFRVWDGP